MNLTNQFVDELYRIANSNISEEIYQQAQRCLIDYLGVTIAGSALLADKTADYIGSSNGESSIVGNSKKVELNVAVLMNAYSSHVLELDDGHRVGMMHLGAPIFSGLLSVAEKKGCTLKELFKGAILGYEAAIRLAEAIQPYHKKSGFHATGTCGTVGCAIGTAVMLGYRKEQIHNVLSAALTSAAGLLEVITGKSEQKPYNIANAAVAGVNAALFGYLFSAPADVLAGERGFLANFCSNYKKEALVAANTEMKICGIYMKPYAACRHCHAPIEAALSISRNQEFTTDSISEIRVNTYDLAVYGHDHFAIDGINSAKMSIPYGVAAAIVYGQAGMEMFTKDIISDEKILGLAQKVKVVADDELSALLPNKRVAEVKVLLSSGEELQYRTDYPKGEPENPITREELYNKFISLVSTANMDAKHAMKIIAFVEENQEQNVRDLFDLVKILV